MTELLIQSMRRTLTTLSSGMGTLTNSVGTVVQGVGTLSAAVSTTVLNLTTEDEDLAEFEEPHFAENLVLDKELSAEKRSRKRHRDKELSVDSGVATDPLQDTQLGSEPEDREGTSPQLHGSSSNSSSISMSSVDEEFLQGLNFVNHHVDQGGANLSALKREDEFLNGLNFHEPHLMHVEMDPESSSSAGGKDEITHVTDDDDILSSSEQQVSADDDLMMSSESDDDEFSLGTVDITATEVFLARKRNTSTESRVQTRSLNHSGNLSDLRRSTNDLSLTPRPLSATPRSKSTLTLSPLNTSEESTYRRPSSLDTVRSRSEVVLNTILEREDREIDLERSVRYNNFVEMSHHDPTTIESFESLSGEELNGSDYQGSGSDFDADEDLIEKKDPFRESFIGGFAGGFSQQREEYQFFPTSCVKRKTLQNFNVGPGPTTDMEATENSVIETISEISSKSQKSCTIARKSQVKLKPLPKINAHNKPNYCGSTANPKVSKISSNGNSLSKSPPINLPDSQPQTFESPPNSKRKNVLKPPSQTNSVQKETLTKFKDSPRSMTQRSNSCTNLNSRTEEILTRSGTLDGFNSLDKTRSYADITYTPGNFTTESSPTVDVAEKSVTVQNSSLIASHVEQPSNSNSSVEESYRGRSGTETSSSTFYSFSTESPEPPKVILNGKTSKSFMTSMRNSFKKLASFLSLSKNKDATLKHPVPPPQHTKPDQGPVVGKNRQYVRPTSPSLAKEFSQRSKSCANLQSCNLVRLEPGAKYKKINEECFVEADLDEPPKATSQANKSSRKKVMPPSSLMSHINNHYTKPEPNRFSSTNEMGFGNLSRSKAPRQSTPAICQSSPGTLLPSPPSQRKPLWRETKASRLRLNRVKVPSGSMSALNL
ncbi:hypothetical protein ACHWQZ_G019233 [Mnemiopsis leidyi]